MGTEREAADILLRRGYTEPLIIMMHTNGNKTYKAVVRHCDERMGIC